MNFPTVGTKFVIFFI